MYYHTNVLYVRVGMSRQGPPNPGRLLSKRAGRLEAVNWCPPPCYGFPLVQS